MAVDVRDLPPDYQRQAYEKWEQEKAERRGTGITPSAPAGQLPQGGAQKPAKYGNRKTERGTLHFDSEKEARRYDELLLMERAGAIRDLRLQVDFTLQESYMLPNGRRVRAIRYRADFTYEERMKEEDASVLDGYYQRKIGSINLDAGGVFWCRVVEDVKSHGTRTYSYKIKRKMMQEKLGITIREV